VKQSKLNQSGGVFNTKLARKNKTIFYLDHIIFCSWMILLYISLLRHYFISSFSI